ncbi:hypothetical protein FS827_22415 [Agrobacterium vitis]|nr:hypothetical protein [Allorhizobium ampelinum]
MLSADQMQQIELIYLERNYIPRMIEYLQEEGFLGDPDRWKRHIKKMHEGLSLLRINSPRNTFRFYRFDLVSSSMNALDRQYFYSILLKTGLNETTRMDLVEKNILGEDNRQRWIDLE